MQWEERVMETIPRLEKTPAVFGYARQYFDVYLVSSKRSLVCIAAFSAVANADPFRES